MKLDMAEEKQNNVAEIAEEIEESSQFLTFEVQENDYAVDIMQVREIRGWTEATRIPNSPEYMRGVINLRGLVIPIFDLKNRFGKGFTDADEKNVVIVVSINERVIGLLVDAVSDILTVKNSQIKNSPSSGDADIEDEYISGLISHQDKMVIILGIENLFESKIHDDIASKG